MLDRRLQHLISIRNIYIDTENIPTFFVFFSVSLGRYRNNTCMSQGLLSRTLRFNIYSHPVLLHFTHLVADCVISELHMKTHRLS